MTLDTPVAFIVYNRPDHTRESFERIRAQQPSHLFLIADGPKAARSDDESLCRQARKVIDEIDWHCQVHRHYADENLGLKQRVVSGLDWVFSLVDQAIILEDDCVAHPDFFAFCDELLGRYANDPRVGAITGNNFQRGRYVGDASYYFSKYFHCWGWASWSRTWDGYDPDIAFWSMWRDSDSWHRVCPDPVERRHWERIFDRSARGEIDSWAYPMQASLWHQGLLTSTPNMNLVTNVGFGAESTHTKNPVTSHRVPVRPVGNIVHLGSVVQDVAADARLFDEHFGGATLRSRQTLVGFLRWLIRGLCRRLARVVKQLIDRRPH